MLTVAYLANEFPSPVEPYVGEEIAELRSRGVRVIAGSVRKRRGEETDFSAKGAPEIVLRAANITAFTRAAWLCVRKSRRIAPLIARIVFRGKEGLLQRLKALVHTFLGACYAELLEGRGIDHIHVHHGYFGSWIAMTAARLLDVGFSMTLHGSDLLVHGTYLDVKLANCTFCLTVSDYNRRFILERYPMVSQEKVLVARLGVDVPENSTPTSLRGKAGTDLLSMLAVGRLHAVKDHAFLVRACAQLAAQGVQVECFIAGDGPERCRLESLIQNCELDDRVSLLGHVPREQIGLLYDRADVVVLTSRSEGIPLVLMEAMARGKIVVAPAITGIPELVVSGKTGFLYEPGSQRDFVDCLSFVHSLMRAERGADLHHHPHILSAPNQLDWVRHAARVQVHHNFNRKKNLESFADLFLQRILPKSESIPDENFVLQQI